MAKESNLGSRWLEIRSYADGIHCEIVENCRALWNGSPPDDDVKLLEPGIGLQILGYSIETDEYLGDLVRQGRRYEVAGLIDTRQRCVKISARFSPQECRFTAAHELGHAALGHKLEVMHRDRPVTGSDCVGDWREREANWFATCFLMPRDLVKARFRDRFATERFELSEASAIAMTGSSLDKVQRIFRDPQDLPRWLAEATHYNGKNFNSLASTFGVSTTAMAIRLEELDLVAPFDSGRNPPKFLLASRW